MLRAKWPLRSNDPSLTRVLKQLIESGKQFRSGNDTRTADGQRTGAPPSPSVSLTNLNQTNAPASDAVGTLAIVRSYFRTSYRPTLSTEGGQMYISGEGLLVILLAGLIAGWLAGKIVAGGGFGPIG